MAIAVPYQTTATVGTAQTSNALYTVPSSTAATLAYARDLVITNAGAPTILIGLTTSASPAATTTGSFQIPSGGSIVLTQCQVPNGAVVTGCTSTTVATGLVSIGYGSVVSVV